MNTHENKELEAAVVSSELIPHVFDNEVIMQRASDGYVNATAMCKANGRDFHEYYRLDSTKAVIAELGGTGDFPRDPLVIIKTTGSNDERGSWVDPHVALHLAQWISPAFTAWVLKWLYAWMKGRPSVTHALNLEDPATLRSLLRTQLDAIDEKDRQLNLALGDKRVAETKRKALGIQLESEIERADMFEGRVAELEPLAEELDQLTTGRTGLYSISETAKQISAVVGRNVGRDGLLDWLRWDLGAVYMHRTEAMQWVINAGYMDNKIHKIERRSGVDLRPTPKVTVKGVPWLTRKYSEWLSGADDMNDKTPAHILEHYRTSLREALQGGADYKRSFWKFVNSLRRLQTTADLPGLSNVTVAMEAGRLTNSRLVLNAVDAL